MASTKSAARPAAINKATMAAGAGALGVAAFALDQQKNQAHCAKSLYGMVADLGDRMTAIESALGVGLSVFRNELDQIAAVKKSNPNNRAVKYFDEGWFAGLGLPAQKTMINIVRTGFENPDSGLGCYAMTPSDYDEFSEFFDAVIRDYHGATKDSVHVTDWDASDVGDNGVLDVTKLGLKELSMRVRVGRNLAGFNLPGSMDREERIRFEKAMLKAFSKLVANPEYGGQVYSLSPDHGDGPNPNLISDAKYNELVKAHVMFKDMDADPYLKSAGIASDWPYGRGCWQSADKQCIIWFGEEDQLRIMCMKTGTRLDEVFNRLKKMLDTVESIDGVEFAKSDKYGYITSCPSNLGTGMRASVHIKVPKLTADGQADPHGNSPSCKAICTPLGLSVRGTGGEHTPIGSDGTIDLSPSARLFIKEKDIITALYKGISDLMEAEKRA
jgi:creatine kinase